MHFFCEFLMKICPDFATNSREECRLPLFQSNLRKQIRNLPKILKFVRKIHYYSKLFTSLLRFDEEELVAWKPPEVLVMPPEPAGKAYS